MTTRCKQGRANEGHIALEEAKEAYRCGNFADASLVFRTLQVAAAPVNTATAPRNSLLDLRGRVQHLAFEADATLCQVRASLSSASMAREPCQDLARNNLLVRAENSNECYRQALFEVLEWLLQQKSQKVSNLLISSCKATVEGILMACVSAIWLYGKHDNVEAGVWVVAQEAHKLGSLLASSLGLSVSLGTRQDILVALEEKLSTGNNHAFDTFRHSWDAARWVCGGNGDQREVVLKRRPDQQARSTLIRLQTHDENCCLQVRQLLLQAIVSDDRLNNKLIGRGSVKDEVRQRDQYLEEAALIESSSIARPFNITIASSLGILIRASEAVQNGTLSVWQTEKLSDEFRRILGTTKVPMDTAKLNLLGCLLAHGHQYDQALEVFQKVLQVDQHRKETIANVAECFWRLGETEKASEIWKYELQRLNSSGDEPGLTRPRRLTVYSISPRDESCSQSHPLLGLWRLFVSLSLLADDTGCILQSAEALRHNNFHYAEFAIIFALLQIGRPSLALATLRRAEKSETTNILLQACWDMYRADAILETESYGPDGVSGISSLCNNTLVEAFQNKFELKAIPDAVQGELLALLKNNRGIACILEGNFEEAIQCFQESCNLILPIKAKLKNCKAPIGLLQPYFNLALIYWKDCRIKEAIDIWGAARGFSSQLSCDGGPTNASGLENLRHTATRAACLLESYEKKSENYLSLHISTWGDLASRKKQIILMDSIILQSAAERQRQQFLASWASQMARSSD